MSHAPEGDGFVDHVAEVPDDTLLYRRVSWHAFGGAHRHGPDVQPDLNGNCFKDHSAERAAELGYPGPCMSVGLGHVLAALGRDPAEAMLEHYPDHGLAAVHAGDLRQLTKLSGDPVPQGVMARPEPAEPWHAVVFHDGVQRRPNAIAEAIARRARWVVHLTHPEARN